MPLTVVLTVVSPTTVLAVVPLGVVLVAPSVVLLVVAVAPSTS